MYLYEQYFEKMDLSAKNALLALRMAVSGRQPAAF
jgi:hypothetical protein